MNYKILIFIYSLFLSAIAILSILNSWANDPSPVQIIELLVDIFFVIGCFLRLSSKVIKWWLFCIMFAVVGEIYLLATYLKIEIANIAFWVGVLSPALIINLKVAGVLKTKNIL